MSLSYTVVSTPLRADGHGWIKYPLSGGPRPYHTGECAGCRAMIRASGYSVTRGV